MPVGSIEAFLAYIAAIGSDAREHRLAMRILLRFPELGEIPALLTVVTREAYAKVYRV